MKPQNMTREKEDMRGKEEGRWEEKRGGEEK